MNAIETRNGYFVDQPGGQATITCNGLSAGGVRPSVAAFALLMEQQLRRHDDRPGWEGDSFSGLRNHLNQERAEFDQAAADTVGPEGADEANMVMMLVQNHGGLDAYLRGLRPAQPKGEEPPPKGPWGGTAFRDASGH